MKLGIYISGVLSTALLTPGWSQKVDPDVAVMEEFETHIRDYVKLRKQVESEFPALKTTVSPEKITHHERELAEKIRSVRRDIGPGNIFTPEIAAEFHRLIALAMQGKDSTQVHQSLQHAEPVNVRVRVNEIYPARVPLQSTPPTLLVNLPPLPPEVEYRVVGRDLVLRDARSNLVIDFLPGAIP